MNVRSRQLTYSQYAGDWDNKVLIILKIFMIVILIIIMIIKIIIDDDVEDWAWDKTNFLAADIGAAEFSIHYNNGLVILIFIIVIFILF